MNQPSDPVQLSPLRLGVTISLTGPGELDWTPVRNALKLWPKSLAGHPVIVDFADDGADPDRAVSVVQGMIDRGVMAIVQFSLSGPAFAVAALAQDRAVPHLAMSPINLSPDQADWTFRLSATAAMMARGLMQHIGQQGHRRLGFIGSADNYGRSWATEISALAAEAGISLAARAEYSRDDRALPPGIAESIVAAAPDAVVIAGPGHTAPLPQTALRRAGFTAPVLQTFGADMRALAQQDPRDFDGTVLPTGPGSAPALLPAEDPARRVIEAFRRQYHACFGEAPDSQAAISTRDAWLILEAAAARAVTRADPADPVALRRALREALFAGAVQAGSGVFRFTPQDRFGLGAEAVLLVRLENHRWHRV